MSNTSIQLKKSGVSGNTPVDLFHGEVALNYADGKLYYKNAIDDVSFITNQDSFATVSVDGTLLLATSPTDILTLTSGENISLTGNSITKTVNINLPNTINVVENVSAQHVIVYDKLYAGIATDLATPLPFLIAQFTGNSGGFVQVNTQNIDPAGSADYVVTADVGNDSSFFIDMGIQGSGLSQGTIYPLDGYLYVQGNTGQLGGNLIIGTTSETSLIETRFVAGGYNSEDNVVFRFNTEVVTFEREIVSNTTSRIYTHANLAFNEANSAASYANSAFEHSNAAYILAQGAFNAANTGAPDTIARETATAAFIQANAAYEQANTGSGIINNFAIYHFPTGDYGFVTDSFYSVLDEIIGYTYDMKTMPTETNGLINLDAGYV
jgi:hypothetical protein